MPEFLVQRIEDGRERAKQLGHTLDAFHFPTPAANTKVARCIRCGRDVHVPMRAVSQYTGQPLKAVGTALEHPCGEPEPDDPVDDVDFDYD